MVSPLENFDLVSVSNISGMSLSAEELLKLVQAAQVSSHSVSKIERRDVPQLQ